VEKGYIYIAQPPLYKIKKGKQEHYVKDDDQLNQYLIQLALEKTQLFTDETTPPIQGQGLEKLAMAYISTVAVIERLGRRYDQAFLEQLTYHVTLTGEYKEDQNKLAGWVTQLQARLVEAVKNATFKIELDYKSSEDFTLTITKRQHGISKVFVVTSAFFQSNDYRKLAKYAEDTIGMITQGSFIKMGERQHPVITFKEAFVWMMKEIKKGQHIQRYKGLGEMNPEQLWETTLDSNNRRLLQVRIEDAVAADEIFTTLMGDVVEPRRDFIVKNALDVMNLDV
jgi:DNA gyrase subunit B